VSRSLEGQAYTTRSKPLPRPDSRFRLRCGYLDFAAAFIFHSILEKRHMPPSPPADSAAAFCHLISGPFFDDNDGYLGSYEFSQRQSMRHRTLSYQ
jgi:hypothetical protein